MKILIASSIDKGAISYLEENHDVICAFNASTDVLKEKIVDREVLIFRSGVQITAEVMAEAPNLSLILRGGSGFDNIDLDYVREHNLEFMRVPEPGAWAVAEMSFGLMLALARNILIADKKTRQGRWMKREMTGYLLKEKTLGIIGTGNIGKQTGKLGAAWGMKVIGCVDKPSDEKKAELKASNIQLVSLETVLSESDFVCLHVPLTDKTRYMIDDEKLSLMKEGSYLINLARGHVVDEQALLKHLTEGKIAGAALDVHAEEGEGKISPLAHLDNVILTPHIGASAFDSQREIGQIMIREIEAKAEAKRQYTATS